MHLPKRLPAFALLILLIASCNNHSAPVPVTGSDTATIEGHPAWIVRGNIYEVNIRQYTPEGTFNAFAKHLDRLKTMGVQTLWFMPVYPISKVDRKGALGSYYAVSNYTAVNPEFGTLEDWKALVKQAHEKGFKVIMDFVPNHTGGDHYWLEKHPDFYMHDSVSGKIMSQYDWTDTRKLNYNNPALVDTMINCFKYWIKEIDVDGFRCDVAGEVPDAFWAKAIPELHKEKNIFMLAEGDKVSLLKAGFDATYTWDIFSMMKKIAKGERPAYALDSVINKEDTLFPKNALLMYFTSNHDENSWNKADYGTMPGDSHAPFAVLTQTIGKSVPLIYSGQEEPFLDSLSFFYKDTIHFEKFARASFYTTLLTLRNSNPALAANASFQKIGSSNDTAVYAFQRVSNERKILVLLNLSQQPRTFTLHNAMIEGSPENVFTHQKETLKNDASFTLPAWGYKLYSY